MVCLIANFVTMITWFWSQTFIHLYDLKINHSNLHTFIISNKGDITRLMFQWDIYIHPGSCAKILTTSMICWHGIKYKVRQFEADCQTIISDISTRD